MAPLRFVRPHVILIAACLVLLIVFWYLPLRQHTVAPTLTARPTGVLPHIAVVLPPRFGAAAVYVLDPQTQIGVLALHAQDPRPMASTTKIMTAVVALMYGDLQRVVTVGPEIHPFAETDASRMCCPYIQAGERYTLRELLAGLLLPSGDDAAATVAVTIAGSQSAFVVRMNAIAAWLGLAQTHFINPHGLDTPNQANMTTAYDLARLTAFALTFPAFRQLVSQAYLTIPANATHPAIRLANTNLLVHAEDSRFGPLGRDLGVDGVKTGYTLRAGYCVVLDARHNGRELIAVVLGESPDATENLRFADGAALLQWAFTH